MTPDTELVGRVLAGDPHAFDTLVTRYRTTVYRQALRRVSLPQDAEEVTQNVFIKSYVHLYQFRREGDFGAWLRTITMRESISWLRSRRPAATDAEAVLEAAPGNLPAPEGWVMDAEVRRIVRNALDSLPESERKVARAFYLEGRSYEEIQAKFGLARSSVAGYLYRARQKLAGRLEGLLSLSWIPGWEALTTYLNLLGNGPASTPATKAAVTTLTVATVTVVSCLTSPSKLPHAPCVKVKEVVAQRSADRSRAAAREWLNRVIRPLSGGIALGTQAALAAEPSKAPPLVVDSSEERVSFKDGDRAWSLVMKDGKLFREENGTRSPASDEDRARFRQIQDDLRDRRQAVARAGGADMLPDADKRRDEERAKRAEAAGKAAEDRADVISRRMEQHSADMERLSEEISRRMERHADVFSRRMEQRAEEISRRAEAHAADIEKHSAEIERWADRIAREAEQRHRDGKPFKGPDEREMRRMMDRVQREVEATAPLRDEARKLAEEAAAGIGPMMEDMKPLFKELEKMQKDVIRPEDMRELQDMQREIQRSIEPAIREAQRRAGDVRRQSERDAQRARRDADRRKDKWRKDKDRAERDKANADREKARAEEDKSREKEEKTSADTTDSERDEADSRAADVTETSQGDDADDTK